jgi:hypothetical protein
VAYLPVVVAWLLLLVLPAAVRRLFGGRTRDAPAT